LIDQMTPKGLEMFC